MLACLLTDHNLHSQVIKGSVTVSDSLCLMAVTAAQANHTRYYSFCFPLFLPLLLQRNALSYFNFLNDEGRSVVGALLPYGYKN